MIGMANDLALSGRVALVTGISRRAGIGYAIAGRLLTLGANVFLQSWVPHDEEQPWGSDEQTIEELIDSLGGRDRRIEHLSLDLAHTSSPGRLVSTATGAFGHVDILIANHARSSKQALEELTHGELSLCFQVNAVATLLLIKEWATRHDDDRPGGRVIIMSSGQHLGPMPGEIPYAASKAAIVGMVPSLASHLAPRGVTVNAVNPGPTDTGWADEETHKWVLERMPFDRWGEPDDAARVIAWLCTDEGRWITGQVINSEGGFRRKR
jgi:3-oxoacyl-[acyl-carrier protein] reductase